MLCSIPVSLKKFEILEMIAKGGMAEVYRAKTTGFSGFEKEVCVKKILPHLTEDESFVNMFINEAKLAATLSYANIVQVHDLCVSANGEYFIVMEYVHGKDLSDVIRAAQLAGREVPPEIAVYIMREVCRGLHYAHNKTDTDGAKLSIIHRDVSPHNVLVSYMGEVKITDFGIAKASSIANKTAVGILKGKYGYMSPEQARGQPLDSRSDIFNTGIVLYELLVGERCFAGSSDFSTLNLMRNAEVTPPTQVVASVPKDLEAIVMKALSKDREKRQQNAMELDRALASWASAPGRTTNAGQLAKFMAELFSTPDSRPSHSSTGVLSLASVAGSPPRSPSEEAAHHVEPSKTKDAPTGSPELGGADEVGKAALERAKRRATRPRSEVAPPPPRPEPAAKEKGAPAAPSSSTPSAKASSGTNAPANGHAKREPKSRPKKPARLKPASATEPPARKKGKQLKTSPKKPVGRGELRPGLTAIHRARARSLSGAAVRAAALVGVALLLGAIVGAYRGNRISRQATFREMELATRAEVPPKKTVTILIDSQPPGATVRFDTRELSDKTPVAIERERDTAAHKVSLSLRGYRKAVGSLKYRAQNLTYFSTELEGAAGKLELSTQPSELEVRLNGTPIGRSPLVHSVPQGTHVLEVGGGDRIVYRKKLTIRAGKRMRIEAPVPHREAMARVRLESEPRARVYLEGKATEYFADGGEIPLAPNVDHRIGFSVGNGKTDREIVVRLSRGETRRVFLTL